MTHTAGGAPAASLLREPTAIWRHPAFTATLGSAIVLALLAPWWWPALSGVLFDLEFAIAARLPDETILATAWFLLPLVGVGCGLLASLSPCILPLVPLNVAAIGAADATGWRAVALSGRFVLGAAAALAVLGVAGDIGGFLLIEQRGPVLIAAGLSMVYFGLAALEVAPLPFVGRGPGGRRRLGPFAAGASFSLVTTPCASPFVGAVLAAASAHAIPGLASASMVGFSLGYTALVFAAGAFAGTLVTRLRGRSFEAPRAASAALLLVVGLGFAGAGVSWF